MVKKARTQGDNFVESRDAVAESMVPSWCRLLNPKAEIPLRFCTPSNDGGIFWFRPFPELDIRDPSKTVPGRNAKGEHSAWSIHCQTANISLNEPGCESVTFILYPHTFPHEKRHLNPYRVFWHKIEAAKKAGEFGKGRAWDSKWNRYLEGGRGRGAALRKYSPVRFYQGAVFSTGDYDYVEDREHPYGLNMDDPLPIIQVSSMCAKNLMKLLDTEKDEWNEEEVAKRPSARYKFGDPVGYMAKPGLISGGLFIGIFYPKPRMRVKYHNTWNGEIRDTQSYEAAVADRIEYNGRTFSARLDESQTKVVIEKRQFWTDDVEKETGRVLDHGVLYFPSEEEQCELIARALAYVPNMLRFAWAGSPQFLNYSGVKVVLNRRVSAAIPGADDVADEATDYEDFESGVTDTAMGEFDATADYDDAVAGDDYEGFAEPADDEEFSEPEEEGFTEPEEGEESTEPADDEEFSDPEEEGFTEPEEEEGFSEPETEGFDDPEEEGFTDTDVDLTEVDDEYFSDGDEDTTSLGDDENLEQELDDFDSELATEEEEPAYEQGEFDFDDTGVPQDPEEEASAAKKQMRESLNAAKGAKSEPKKSAQRAPQATKPPAPPAGKKAPTKAPAKAPAKATSSPPAKAPAKAQANAGTKAPAKNPTKAPAKTTPKAPAKPAAKAPANTARPAKPKQGDSKQGKPRRI